MAWLSEARQQLQERLSQAAESLQLQERLGQAAEALHVQEQRLKAVGESLQLQEKISRATETVQQRFAETVQQTLFSGDLAAQLDHEARGFSTAAPEAVVAALQRWEARLMEPSGPEAGQADAGGLPGGTLAALLRSGALVTAVVAVVQAPLHREALLGRGPAVGHPLREALLRVLGRVSNLPQESLDRLLALLLRAQEELEAYEADPEAAQSAAQTARWLHALLQASLTGGQEADLLQQAAHVRAARRALDAAAEEGGSAVEVGQQVWAAEAAAPPLPLAGTGAVDPDGAPRPTAAAAGPLRWRRARVAAAGGGGVEVEWLDAPAPASGSGARPAAAPAALVLPTSLGRALSSAPRAAAPPVGARAGEQHGEGGAEERDLAFLGARCRELRALLAECRAATAAAPSRAGPGPASAGSLRELREERERRAEVLAEEAGKCQDVVAGCQTQVRQSSESFRLELEGLRGRREANARAMDELLGRKRQLLLELREVDEQLAAAETTSRELSANEKRLEENMLHVSQELSGLLSTEGRRHEDLIEEHRTIVGACELAKLIEAEVAAREAAAAAAGRDCEGADGVVLPALASVCLQAELRRLLALEAAAAAASSSPGPGPTTSEQVAVLAEEAAAEAEQLARDLWAGLGLSNRSPPAERQPYDDALALRDRCRELAGAARDRRAPPGDGGPAAAAAPKAKAGPAAAEASRAEAPPAEDDVAEDAAE